jgi:hypothetical protein
MEKLDPTGSGDWERLPDGEQEFYRDVILEVLEAPDLIERALKSQKGI